MDERVSTPTDHKDFCYGEHYRVLGPRPGPYIVILRHTGNYVESGREWESEK